MSTFAEKLREKGLKVTPQRMAIYSMLCNTAAHPTAENVWEEIKRDFPAVSFNTVYTTLGAFEQAGLIQRLHIGGNKAHYDAHVAPHIHLHCQGCGRVEDCFEGGGVDLVAVGRQIADQAGYAVGKIELNLYGFCSQCKAR
ncbi:MAG: Fur family transcriptional regulator peroxide stress response regulator [Bacillota bacterium]|nr:MAG: Fur family transcriptional regulator peroxide stress response regulator [Bacillota bacterium]MBS3951219.1 transcriptional repressor [Peptococcaceae bacterium]